MTLRPILLAAVLTAFASPAFADRDPTAEERTAIEARLKQEGYTRWEDIELEDDGSVWEVDDAVWSDGREYDLHLAPVSLDIVKKDAD